MPQFIPRHYDIHVWTLAESRKFLDVKHQLGWRVVQMQPHGRKIIFLFEKIGSHKKPAEAK